MLTLIVMPTQITWATLILKFFVIFLGLFSLVFGKECYGGSQISIHEFQDNFLKIFFGLLGVTFICKQENFCINICSIKILYCRDSTSDNFITYTV